MQSIRLLVIPASVRTGSLNLQLAQHAAAVARAAGHQVELLDLRALALPVYDGDLEAVEGVPAGALRLQQAIAEADAVVFLVDGRVGVTALDKEIANKLRKAERPVFVAVNKAEGMAE